MSGHLPVAPTPEPRVPAKSATSVVPMRWRRVRPLVEGTWGASCIVGGVVLLGGKAALLGTAGLAVVTDVGSLANLALIGGGLMFLREAKRHAAAGGRAATPADRPPP